ncbi:CBS domain-containing protein [Reichenbachiella agarivorans]|uniref:CBS domain-containing protein n=1 Tax=Reichenbachiella agarivorans TaxID=2979464 RepID=A0ABY6CN64_9BACT|nr:CBS domain-containing protein [Reichenbachiella agarivorans]UXP31959.1 CBS domain-containing protein [Reichenbachiella agarivorans]
MIKDESVSKIMTRDVVTINITDPMKEVINVFEQIKIRHLPVMAEDTLVGIISHSDIERLKFGSDLMDKQTKADESILDMISVNQLMKHNPVTIGVNHSILDVAKLFARCPFHALPVTENNQLVGIVTTTDLMKYIIALSEQEK